MVVADIQNIQFENNYFDLVICNHILEHIPDDRKAMSELYRILKPSGCAFLMVPLNLGNGKTYEDSTINTPNLRRIHFGQEDHVRYYGMDFEFRLESVDFKIKSFKAIDFEEQIIQQYALLSDDIVWIGIKSMSNISSKEEIQKPT